MRNIFLEKSCTKCGRETIPRLSNLWINSLKVYTLCFYCISGKELLKCIKTKLQTSCFTSCKALFEKKRSETSLPALFPA